MAAFILKMLGLPVQLYTVGCSGGTNYEYPTSKIACYPNDNNLYKYVNPILSSCCNCAKGLNVVNIANYVPILGEPGTDIEHSYYGYTDSFIHDNTCNSDGTSVNVGYNTQDATIYGPVPGDSTTYNMVVDGCKYSRCCCCVNGETRATFQDYYNAVPKVNEANIPYLHGELVKYGTLPWNVICSNVVCETADELSCYCYDCYDLPITTGSICCLLTIDNRMWANDDHNPTYMHYCCGFDILTNIGCFGCCTNVGYARFAVFCGVERDDSTGGLNFTSAQYPKGSGDYYFMTAVTGGQECICFPGGIYRYQTDNTIVCVDHIRTNGIYLNCPYYSQGACVGNVTYVMGEKPNSIYVYIDVSNNGASGECNPTFSCDANGCGSTILQELECATGQEGYYLATRFELVCMCSQEYEQCLEYIGLVNCYGCFISDPIPVWSSAPQQPAPENFTGIIYSRECIELDLNVNSGGAS